MIELLVELSWLCRCFVAVDFPSSCAFRAIWVLGCPLLVVDQGSLFLFRAIRGHSMSLNVTLGVFSVVGHRLLVERSAK